MSKEPIMSCKCRRTPLEFPGDSGSILFGPDTGCVSLASETTIPTPDGWVRLEDVEPGQQVFDELGRGCTVAWVLPPRREPVCRVRFDDGASILAGLQHPWMTRTPAVRGQISQNQYCLAQWSSGFWPATTQELRTSLTHRSGNQEHAEHSIPLAQALKLPDVDYVVHPYVLGLWLGDGTSRESVITCSVDDEPHYRERMQEIGENWRILNRVGNTLRCTLAGPPKPRLRTRLGELDVLENKHIPEANFRASEGQRQELLKGLIDSDGHIYAQGTAEFVSTEQRLAEGALELIISLGMKGTIRKGDASAHLTRERDPYRVRFSPIICVASLPRKAERAAEAIRARGTNTLSKVKQRYIKSVDDSGIQRVTCLSVDSQSGMMLAGRNMIPVKTAGGWCQQNPERPPPTS